MTGVIARTEKANAAKIRAALKADGLAYRLIKKTGLTREQIKKKAEALIAMRVRIVGYIKAGWYKASQAFGGRGGKVKPGGLAAQGEGRRAKPSNLTATLTNKTIGAVEVSGPALAKAMDEKRRDMLVYIARKLRQRWGKR